MNTISSDNQSIDRDVFIEKSFDDVSTVGSIGEDMLYLYDKKYQHDTLYWQINYRRQKKHAFYRQMNEILGGD